MLFIEEWKNSFASTLSNHPLNKYKVPIAIDSDQKQYVSSRVVSLACHLYLSGQTGTLDINTLSATRFREDSAANLNDALWSEMRLRRHRQAKWWSTLGPRDDVFKWKHFQRYWTFARRIHRSPVNSPHKGQWRGPLFFSLICTWINGWVNNRKAGDLRRHHAHCDVIVMRLYNQHTKG